MSSFLLANVFSQVTAKTFFCITMASVMLFLILNVRIRTVLDRENGQQMSKLQIVFEFPSHFIDDSPIHDDDDVADADTDDAVVDDVAQLPQHIQPLLLNGDDDDGTIWNVSSANTTTHRPTFHHLFQTLPHPCVIEQDCHLHISDAPYFTDNSLVVIGMVRDAEKDVVATLQQLDEISCIFDTIVFIFYESNSKDNTPYILQDWQTMYLDGSHCDHFRYNPATSSDVSAAQKQKIESHRPTLIKKILFHDFVDVRGKNRIVRYVIFRNMLLERIKSVTQDLSMDGFDYVMMIDLDLKEFDSKSAFRDLHDSPYSVMCANGLFKLEIMRDTFASVMINGTWLYTYHSLYDDHFRDLVYWPYERYQAMNSCFGGLAFYKSSQKLLDTGCEYVVLEDMKQAWEYAEKYKASANVKQPAWPKERDWFQIEGFRKPLLELQQMFFQANVKVNKERRKICEHLSYHYCLRAHGYQLAIARDMIVYYFDLEKMANNPI